MATVKTSPAVTSATVTGVVTAFVAGVGTVLETDLAGLVTSQAQPRVSSTNTANGNVSIWMPPTISSITINGNVYAVTLGYISNVLPADATAFLAYGFQLVSAKQTNP